MLRRSRPRFCHADNIGRLLDQQELQTAIKEVASKAKKEYVAVALAGGCALQRFGSPRLTSDVDIIADRKIHALQPTATLSFGGYKSTTDSGAPVDVILRNDAFVDLYDAALTHAIPRGPAILVVPLEYLVAIKMVAGRTKDMADLEWIISASHVDLEKAKAVVQEYLGAYAVQDFDALVAEITWQASRNQ